MPCGNRAIGMVQRLWYWGRALLCQLQSAAVALELATDREECCQRALEKLLREAFNKATARTDGKVGKCSWKPWEEEAHYVRTQRLTDLSLADPCRQERGEQGVCPMNWVMELRTLPSKVVKVPPSFFLLLTVKCQQGERNKAAVPKWQQGYFPGGTLAMSETLLVVRIERLLLTSSW